MPYRYLVVFFFILIRSAALAQAPWQGFLPGRMAHYAVKPPEWGGLFQPQDSIEAVYEPARFDSSSSHGPNRFYYPMKVAGTFWWNRNDAYNYPTTQNTTPWYGSILRVDSTEEEYFPNAGGSVLLRRQHIHSGDTALAWISGQGRLYGICTGLDTATVLAELDSVAQIRIVHLDSAGSPAYWHNRTISLSRSHGWVTVFNLHMGLEPSLQDADSTLRTLAFLSGSPIDYTYPPYRAWYAYRPGDVMQYSTYRFRDMVAQCFQGPSCGNGLRASETELHHRRLLRRYSSSQGEALEWVDSSQSACQVMANWPYPDPVVSPISVDTVTDILQEVLDSTRITGVSFELRANPQQAMSFSPILVRRKGLLYRAKLDRGLSGGSNQFLLSPFGSVSIDDNWSPQGQCRYNYSLRYATCNGDTLGTLGFFTGIRKAKLQANLLTLSPNPAGSTVMVRANVQRPLAFELFRADGTRVLSLEVSSATTLNVASLPPCLYHWQARQGDQWQTGKLVKE